MLPEPVEDHACLLLDHHAVAEVTGCRQVFHPVEKDGSGPVLSRTEEWEGRGPYTWTTRLLWNPDTRQYDFYYIAFDERENAYRWGLAVSDDGWCWIKPDLGVETFQGRPARNMLTVGAHRRHAVRCVVRDPRPECPPRERCKAIRFTYDGEYVSYSADGRHWVEDPGNPRWQVPSDVIHAFWDPRCQRFAAYFKVWEVHGETPDAASPGGYRPVTAYLPFFEVRESAPGLVELSGPRIWFHPEAQAEVRPETLVLHAADQGQDDGGGAPLTGAWHARRVIAWAESDDFRHWQHERVVLACDGEDRPDANIQFAFVWQQGGYYLASLTLHDERGHFEQQLAFSRDGLTWSRPWREPFIGLGPPGAFDSGMVLSPTDPIAEDTRLVFHYGGFDLLHWQDPTGPWSSAIGRAFLRRDGFASWDSLPGETGTVVTPPVPLSGDTLWVNADAAGGGLSVEIADEAGRPIPGLEASACVLLQQDTSHLPECMSAMAWRSATRLHDQHGRPVRLRFCLQGARLFSYRFR